MSTNGKITPSSLSLKDLIWQIEWDKDKCTLCGQCTAVCPVQTIELAVFRKRVVDTPVGLGVLKAPVNVYKTWNGIRQKTDPTDACIGCGNCYLVCPDRAISVFRYKPVKAFNNEFSATLNNASETVADSVSKSS